ncbi:diguanylate cyclase domain-containing protein [Psychromonas antarctica]|uniref:diguanylate cyclase domain-containing protein n=1 Tax=Psychromonas antarctica TaxID=67573 RepID=UPI001EE7EE3D|nr:diguanylate cyclase [Psychromonas antarctica]MCG6201340.1 diguanylate cyclase [Psychromonas antarctica]
MSKLLSFISLFFFLTPLFGELNESTKPSHFTVYLDQNLPYSGFDLQQNAQGLIVDYWQQWSQKSGIIVNYSPSGTLSADQLFTNNQPSVYCGLAKESTTLADLKKSPLLAIETHFYYFSTHKDSMNAFFSDNRLPLIVGGLLPEAQQLPFFMAAPRIIYKEYPGLLELLIDLYYEKIDALVLFNGVQRNSHLLDRFLSLFFDKQSLDASSNELFVYTSDEQQTLLNWIDWGKQLENMPTSIAVVIDKAINPIWGTSAEMTAKIILIVCVTLLFFLVSYSWRKKDLQFKYILDSSPYPLVIFSLDGRTVYYLNDEVKFLLPFKKIKSKYAFEDVENQLLLSRFINKESHKIIIEDKRLRLLVDNSFHDIELSAKRIHYKRKTAWFCHLKDITALLQAEQKLTEERELLRTVLDSIPEQIAYKSPKGTIIGCNKSWASANNTTVSYATGRRALDIMPIDIINKDKQQEEPVWKGEKFNTQEWIQQQNGELGLINIVKLPLHNNDGAIFAILTIDRDITPLYNLNEKLKDENLQRKKTEKALSKQNVLLSTVFSASLDPIGLIDKLGRIIGANNAFAQLMGATNPEEIIGQLQSELLPADRADWAERQNKEVLESGEPLIFEELIFFEGKKIWYEVHKTPFKDPESDYQGIVIMSRDISTRKQTEEKLSSEASDFEVKMLHDQLTGIANRRAFDVQFSKLWKEACDERELFSLVMCDIDFFKAYNDNYGHQKGDQALLAVANALQSVCDSLGCFVARYGGEEFVFLIKGGNATKALKVAENIRQAVENAKIEHLYSSVNNIITLSMGLSSIFPSELNSMKILLAEADGALYNAKGSGRDQICVH